MTGTPVEYLPEGYDVYESPETGQVHLRRSPSTPITPQERETVSDGIRRYAGLEHFLIDVQGNSLVVYLAGPKSLVELVQKCVPSLGKDDFFEMF